MYRYSWPGSIREMVATISRTALSSRDRLVQADDVPFLRPENGNGHGLPGEQKCAAGRSSSPAAWREVTRHDARAAA